jgi:hypothetical protein
MRSEKVSRDFPSVKQYHISKRRSHVKVGPQYSLFTFHLSSHSSSSSPNSIPIYLYHSHTESIPRTSSLPLVALCPAECSSYLDSNIMSSASSYASSHGAMASRLRTLALGSKPHINIVLNDERSSYSTLDKLSGKVEIAVSHSTRFDEIDIQFIGMLCDVAPLPHGN